MAKRESIWQVIWDPAGESPRVLLDYGDVMDGEMSRTHGQLLDLMRYDFALAARPYGRGNARRRLKLVREVDAADPLEALTGMFAAASTDPWGTKALLRVRSYGMGPSTYVRAAILNVARVPLDLTANGVPGWRETLSLRVNGGLADSGSPITITGGWYNPPIVGGGTASGGITVILTGTETGLQPGDVVKVTGISGVRNGSYTVTGVRTSGGNTQVDIDAASNQRPRNQLDGIVGGGSSGWVAVTGQLRVKGYGLGDGATYGFTVNGGGMRGFSSIISGVGTSTTVELSSQIDYEVWYMPGADGPGAGGINPLPIDGGNHANGLEPPASTVCSQTGPPVVSVQLYRNGETYGSPKTFKPSWAVEKTYGPGPSGHTLDGLGTLTMTLHGPGSSGEDDDPGISGSITGGTVEKLS